MGDPKDDELRRRALEDTVPGARLERPEPAAQRKPPADSEDVVTSAEVSTLPPHAYTTGSVSLSGQRLPEELAREILNRRFESAGLALVADYRLSEDELLLSLDGFDPDRRIGYQFLSHLDADVVTDFDATTSRKLEALAASGRAHVLVIHDHDAPTGDDLIRIADEFLGQLGLVPAS